MAFATSSASAKTATVTFLPVPSGRTILALFDSYVVGQLFKSYMQLSASNVVLVASATLAASASCILFYR
ncbi:MAG: hypothetical protein R3B12_02860 [Candidatus Saccharimonadales bacterium]